MEKPKEEIPTPQPRETRLPDAPEVLDNPDGEKTPTKEEIETLHRQKEHQRLKREEAEDARAVAEEEARLAKEELERLKKENQTSTPSDEELARRYPDWEYKEESEKDGIRREEAREKRLRQLEEKIAWDTDYNRVLDKYPQLAESKEDFKKEAYKHPKSTDLEVIAKSFLFDRKASTPDEPISPKPSRLGLETPTGGPKEPPTTGMTLEDIERLRKEDPRKYSEMIKKGLIKIPKE